MGCAVRLLGNCVGFMSKTQGLLALSSGEAELHASGYGVAEAIFARTFLRGVSLAPKVTLVASPTLQLENRWRLGAELREELAMQKFGASICRAWLHRGYHELPRSVGPRMWPTWELSTWIG